MGCSMSCVDESSAKNRVDPTCAMEQRDGGQRLQPQAADGKIYHEKQSRELCALHALNNLFQSGTAFSKKDMDDICYKLSPVTLLNPHRSMLGLGNYDVNVMMAALQRKNHEAIWFDKRKDLGKLCLDYIQGFILNIPTDYKLMGYVKLPLKRKHWITVRKVQGSYYNLDSKLDAPKVIGQEKELLDFLRDQVQNVEKELLLAVTTEVAQSGDWYRFDDLSRPEREAVLREHVDGSNGVPSFPDDVTLNSEENSGAGGAQRTCRVTVKTCAEEGDSTANNS